MTDAELIAAHIAAHGVTLCPAGEVSQNIKFKSWNDHQFSGWELDGWQPGGDAHRDYAGGSAEYDMREEYSQPEMLREMSVDEAMNLNGRTHGRS